MEKKDKLKAVIEMFMDILSAEEVKSEPKTPTNSAPQNIGDNLYNSFINPSINQEKLKDAVKHSAELINKIEEIDRRNAYERSSQKQQDALKVLREQYSNLYNNKELYGELFQEKLNEDLLDKYKEWEKDGKLTVEKPLPTLEVEVPQELPTVGTIAVIESPISTQSRKRIANRNTIKKVNKKTNKKTK